MYIAMNNTDNEQKESINDQLFDWLKTLTQELPKHQKQMHDAIMQKGKENEREKAE